MSFISKIKHKLQIYSKNYDPLTGLIGRDFFISKLAYLLNLKLENRRNIKLENGYNFSLFYIGISSLNNINETYGLSTGDLILKEIALKISNSIRDNDVASRFEGNKFVLIINGIYGEKTLIEISDRLQKEIEEPIKIKDKIYNIKCRIGIVVPVKVYSTADELIIKCEIALKKAKEKNSNNYLLFDDDRKNNINENLSYDDLIKKSLLNHTFVLYFQPIICLSTGAVHSCEALLRMRNDLNFTPYKLIQAAEKSGEISKIGRYVFKEACLYSKSLEEDGIKCEIKVNISPYELYQKNFFTDIENIIHDMKISEGRIGIELTENVFINYNTELEKNLKKLKNLGIRISLDDFGTGFSNLSNLKNLPLDSVKIDRSFLNDAIKSEKDAALTASIIVMGHTLSLKVIAEGIEKQEQVEFLKNFECDYGQGFVFSPALEGNAFKKYLEENKKKLSLSA